MIGIQNDLVRSTILCFEPEIQFHILFAFSSLRNLTRQKGRKVRVILLDAGGFDVCSQCPACYYYSFRKSKELTRWSSANSVARFAVWKSAESIGFISAAQRGVGWRNRNGCGNGICTNTLPRLLLHLWLAVMVTPTLHDVITRILDYERSI